MIPDTVIKVTTVSMRQKITSHPLWDEYFSLNCLFIGNMKSHSKEESARLFERLQELRALIVPSNSISNG